MLIRNQMLLAPEGDAGSGAAPAQPAAPAAPGEGQPADAPKADAKPPEPKPDAPAPKPEREERDVAARLELKRRQTELTEREGKVKLSEADATELQQLREARRFAAEDPLAYLEAAGLTAEKVFKAAKEGRKVDPATRKALLAAEAAQKRLDERDASEKKAREDATAKENNIKLRGSIGALLKSEADRFELTQANGDQGVDAVHEALLAYYQRFQRAPNAEQAKQIADNVEKFYRGQAEKYASTKYLKGKLAPKPPPKDDEESETPSALDNSADASPRAKPAPGPRKTVQETLREEIEEVKRERAAREAAEASRG